MAYDLVIKNGTIVNADSRQTTDVGITDGKIAAIGSNLPGKETIDAAGKLVIPGGVDPHVHLEMPTPVATSSDDWFTGTRAAAIGGTTTIIDFVEAAPDQTLLAALAQRRAQAEAKAVIDFGLHMTIDRVDADTLAQIPDVIKAGVSSFKCYTTYSMRLDDDQLLAALNAVGQAGGLTIVHAESDAIIHHLRKTIIAAGHTEPRYHPISRPPASEGEAVERVLAIADAVGAPVYIVHVSTELGAAAIQRAQQRGQAAYGETCPQYLVLNDSVFEAPGFEGAKYICSPPLRKPNDQKALWQALNDQVFQAVGTDHCPFRYDGVKNLGRPHSDPPPFTQIPGGIPGIEARVALLHTFGVKTGQLTLEQWVQASSTGPAKMFGIYPQKGAITVGADADIVIFDPEQKTTLSVDKLHENVDYTIYEGFELTGYPVATIANGQVIAQNGEFSGDGHLGQFLQRGSRLTNKE